MEDKVQKLLQPRYEVIADYFLNPHKVGDLLPFNGESWHVLTVTYNDEFGDEVRQQNWALDTEIDRYPHLFRKLSWWEKREESEMPEYFMIPKDDDYEHDVDKFFKVSEEGKWGFHEGEVYIFNYTKGGGTLIDYIQPATESDYLTFINKPK